MSAPRHHSLDADDLSERGREADNEAALLDDLRACVINPIASATIADTNMTLFNPSKNVSEQYDTGRMGRGLGFKFDMDQNVVAHTIGTYVANVAGGAVTANGNVASGSSVVLARLDFGRQAEPGRHRHVRRRLCGEPAEPSVHGSASPVRRHLVLQHGGRWRCNDDHRVPALVVSGAYQNVSAQITSGAAMKVFGASSIVTPQNMAFHRDAFTFACADLELPGGVWMAKRVTSKKLGISMRVVKAYDITNDRAPCVSTFSVAGKPCAPNSLPACPANGERSRCFRSWGSSSG